MFSRENGFTLIELMVVIAISTLVIAGMGISYAKSLPDRRLAKAARNLYNDLQMARSKAVLNMENIDVVFNEQNNQYQNHYQKFLNQTHQ